MYSGFTRKNVQSNSSTLPPNPTSTHSSNSIDHDISNVSFNNLKTVQFDKTALTDAEIEAQQTKNNRAPRPPTLYSYTHTKTHNKVGSSPQGPHTVGYSAVNKALEDAIDNGADLKDIADSQIPHPNEWEDLIKEETSSKNKELQSRIERVKGIYKERYEELYNPKTNLERKKGLIHELMQLHPHATYGWKSMTPVSKKSSKGKGETSDLANDKNIDTPASHVLSKNGVKSLVSTRRTLLKDSSKIAQRAKQIREARESKTPLEALRKVRSDWVTEDKSPTFNSRHPDSLKLSSRPRITPVCERNMPHSFPLGPPPRRRSNRPQPPVRRSLPFGFKEPTCSYRTTRGKPCGRNRRAGSKFCYPHSKQYDR